MTANTTNSPPASSNPSTNVGSNEIQIDQLKKEFSEFGLYEQSGYTLIRMNQQLSPEAFESLEKRTELLEDASARHFIIDCSNMRGLNQLWIRYCLQLKKRLAEKEKKIRLVNVKAVLLNEIKIQGLTSLQISLDLETALADIGLRRPGAAFDVSLVNPFLASATNVIKSLTGSESRQGKLFTRPGGGPFFGDLSGVLKMENVGFRGLFIVSFPKDTIYKVAGKMLGSEFTEVNPMLISAVGEIGNIIFSQGRKALNEIGYGLQTALPQVFTETTFPAEFNSFSGLNIVVPFETDIGKYFAEIRL